MRPRLDRLHEAHVLAVLLRAVGLAPLGLAGCVDRPLADSDGQVMTAETATPDTNGTTPTAGTTNDPTGTTGSAAEATGDATETTSSSSSSSSSTSTTSTVTTDPNATWEEPDREHILMAIIGGNQPQSEFTPEAMQRCKEWDEQQAAAERR